MSQDNLVIHKLFSQSASRVPRKTALKIKNGNQWEEISYEDLQAGVLKVAAFLFNQGFKKADRAVIFLENRSEWVMVYLGILHCGLISVPLDSHLNSEEAENLILDSGAKVLFCSQEIFHKKITPQIQGLLNKIVIIDFQGEEKNNCFDFRRIEKITPGNNFLEISPEDTASLIYTSGTTDKPKGVLLTHKNICSNFLSISKLNICLSSDSMFSILPLHHTYPLMAALIVPLLSGATVVFPPIDFQPQDLVKIVRESQVSILVGVPQLFSLIHNAIFEKVKKIPPIFLPFIKSKIRRGFGGKLRLFVSGGARLEPKVARNLTNWGFSIIEGYGLTETSPIVTLNSPGKVKFGSVGKPISGVEIKIENPDASGIGQVAIRGPNVMKGYFKQPQLTSAVIKDNWFFSGDLGYIDREGYLFITGREKEVIILSTGKTVYPEELEAYYSQSPYIKEICISQKEEKIFNHSVETLYAVVVPDLDYFRRNNEMNIYAKIRWELENLAKKLANYKHIMGFTVIKEDLPRTALKKIKRYEVRERYLDKGLSRLDVEKDVSSSGDKEILSRDTTKKIIEYISKALAKQVSLDSNLELDLGIDSLSKVELALGLESLLSIKIPDNTLYTVSTIREVVMKIEEIVDKKDSAEYALSEDAHKTWSQILKEPLKEKIRQRIRLTPRIIDWLISATFKGIFLFIFRGFWFLRIEKSNLLPKEGPYIICPNHASYLDGFVVFCSLPLKLAVNTYFIGNSDIFEHPSIRWAMKLGRLIPIDPSVNLTDAMQAVSFLLSEKKIVCIFPEGQRSIDEYIGEFKKGVGILIKELDIPAVPVYIKNSHRSWPRNFRLPRFCPMKIIFGRAHSREEILSQKQDLGSDDYENISLRLKEEVEKLKC